MILLIDIEITLESKLSKVTSPDGGCQEHDNESEYHLLSRIIMPESSIVDGKYWFIARKALIGRYFRVANETPRLRYMLFEKFILINLQ